LSDNSDEGAEAVIEASADGVMFHQEATAGHKSNIFFRFTTPPLMVRFDTKSAWDNPPAKLDGLGAVGTPTVNCTRSTGEHRPRRRRRTPRGPFPCRPVPARSEGSIWLGRGPVVHRERV
jgi:hypothetical protein